MSILHAKQSGLPADEGDPAHVEPTDWYAAHVGSSLTVKDEGTPLDTGVTSVDFTGAGVTATTVGHAVTVAIPGGGATPTLAEVLVAGNSNGGQAIVGADGVGDANGHGAFMGGGSAAPAGGGAGGTGSIYGGDGGLGRNGGPAAMTAGYSNGGNDEPSSIVAYAGPGDGTGGSATVVTGSATGGSGKAGGDLTITTGAGDGAGRHGQVIVRVPTADPSVSGALWNYGGMAALSGGAIYSQAAGAPGGTLTTLFYGDTTAVTGGLYVWNVSAYRKVTGVLP